MLLYLYTVERRPRVDDWGPLGDGWKSRAAAVPFISADPGICMHGLSLNMRTLFLSLRVLDAGTAASAMSRKCP